MKNPDIFGKGGNELTLEEFDLSTDEPKVEICITDFSTPGYESVIRLNSKQLRQLAIRLIEHAHNLDNIQRTFKKMGGG